MTDEMWVQERVPEAQVLGGTHGQVCIWSERKDEILSEWQHSGTREARLAAAWLSARRRMEAEENGSS
jgi:hypothetical protein